LLRWRDFLGRLFFFFTGVHSTANTSASSGSRGLRFAGVDNEIEQPLVSANSNHVSRRDVTEYGIGEFKPKPHFLRIAGKELSNQIRNIRDFTQSLRHRLRDMRIEAHRGFRHLRDLAQVRFTEFGEVRDAPK
jgi:hypothetical protein